MDNKLIMRKSYILLMLAAVFAAVGCDNESLFKSQNNSTDVENGVYMCFRAIIDKSPDSKVTKAILADTPADNYRRVLWQPKDSVYVTNGRDYAVFSNLVNETSAVAEFEGVLPERDSYHSFYPYAAVSEYVDGKFSFGLAPVQRYYKDGVNPDCLPMAARLSDGTFFFRNLCGILVLNMVGEDKVSSIVFSGKDSLGNAIKVAGNAKAVFDDSGIPILELEENALDSVVLNCAGTDGSGVLLNKTVPTSFHIVLPPCNYSMFTLSIYSVNGGCMKIIQNKPLSIKRAERTTTTALPFMAGTDVNGFESVDLGLSVKWATCNVGALRPEHYGDYYASGEIEPKPSYTLENYRFYLSGSGYYFDNTVKLSKYITDANHGTWDGKTVLDPEDDVAKMKMGGSWRMPTESEFEELIENCTWTWSNQNGVNGFVVSSKKPGYEGRSIFLPAAGQRSGNTLYSADGAGSYYSSSIRDKDVVRLSFEPDRYWISQNVRYEACPVRPVCLITPASLELSSESVDLFVGRSIQLTVTAKNGSRTVTAEVEWRSDNTDVAVVDGKGNVSAVGVGKCHIIAVCGTLEAVCEIASGYEPVDMGLSVAWATCNVGASAPEQYGSYYAWGEITTKSKYNWESYRFRISGYNDEYVKFSKYVTDPAHGTYDGKLMLDREDDVARVEWGGRWRIPTWDEVTELVEQCTWTWTMLNGVKGHLVESTLNGNSIFIPAAGYYRDTSVQESGSVGGFWANSTVNTIYGETQYFIEQDLGVHQMRRDGWSVRPVHLFEATSMSISRESASLYVGNSIELKVTAKNGSRVVSADVEWTSSNAAVATVNAKGMVNVTGPGKCRITAKSGSLEASCEITAEYEAVDLGLSVAWATCNVGASAPEQYGSYYAWGEIETKTDYEWSTYMWCKGSSHTLTKYCTESSWGYNGYTDGKIKLDKEDDVAHVKWGGDWRIPTKEELEELIDNCIFTWTTQNGVNGFLVTSRVSGYSNASIFLPAGDVAWSYAFYWSSTIDANSPDNAWYLCTSSEGQGMGAGLPRSCYRPVIRPVCPK